MVIIETKVQVGVFIEPPEAFKISRIHIEIVVFLKQYFVLTKTFRNRVARIASVRLASLAVLLVDRFVCSVK